MQYNYLLRFLFDLLFNSILYYSTSHLCISLNVFPYTVQCFIIMYCILQTRVLSPVLVRFAETPVGFRQRSSLSCCQTHTDSSFLSCRAETCLQNTACCSHRCSAPTDRPAESVKPSLATQFCLFVEMYIILFVSLYSGGPND